MLKLICNEFFEQNVSRSFVDKYHFVNENLSTKLLASGDL